MEMKWNETKRNEMKRNKTKLNENEMKRNEMKGNEVKWDVMKRIGHVQVPEFEEAAFSAPLNKVRRVKTKHGWHLVQVLAER